MRIAITGGTGFVGSNLLGMATGRGHDVRALTRRTVERRPGVTWVEGALDRDGSLDRLLEGCEAVIHVAGVINGDAEEFRKGNVEGTAALAAAAACVGVRRFVHVSSLAAREPGLSLYGQSKCAAEQVVTASGSDWTIVRPPAIYGPRDKEILELFRLARLRVLPVPAGTALSVIHVDDLCRLLLDLLDAPASIGRIYEADDGRPGGWRAEDFARAIGAATGRTIRPLSLSRRLLTIGARIDRLARGDKAMLTPDRVAYYTHPDWVAAADKRPPAEVWRPEIDTVAGLAETARWYREAGWLR